MTPPATPQVDVAIIGFGPTGAMAALRCAQRGLTVVAIDASTEIYPLPRAIGLDAEGARLFHTAGLGDALAACSTPLRGAEFVTAARERVVGFDLPEGFVGPLGHPPSLMFEQPQLEAALRAAAVAAGVDVRLGVTAQGLEFDDDGAQIITDQATIDARWIIAADGASSWARKHLDVPLIDQGYDQPWLVVDTTLIDPDLALPDIVQQVCDPQRVTTFVPGHGTRRRWEFRLHPGETAEQALADVETFLAPWGTPDQLRVDRTAVYRFHALIAEQFRVGPIFLAGDAAHQMPPFNGQGMCSGLRDADNLAWKFALVSQGQANDSLLDSYDTERRPHAIATVEHTCDAGRLIDAIAAGIDVTTEAGYGGGRSAPRVDAGIVDGDHPSVGSPLPLPRGTDQTLDDLLGDGFAVLTTTPTTLPPAIEAMGARSIVVAADALPSGWLDSHRAVVVRPDRLVAAVTNDLDATAEHLVGQCNAAPN